MNSSNFRISLDVHEINSQVTMHAKKGDTARKIFATLTEKGRPYRITDDCTAVFTAKKPDGNILYNACVIQGNIVEYAMTAQTTAVAGELLCELRLYGNDSALITSPCFTIVVDDTVYSDGDVVESSSEFSELTQLIDETKEIKEDYEDSLGSNGTGEGVNVFIQAEEPTEMEDGDLWIDEDDEGGEGEMTAYTALRRTTNTETQQVSVHCHSMEAGQTYALHLYTVNRRRGSCFKGWRHTPNYDAEKRNVSRKGYGHLTGSFYQYLDGSPLYPEVPDWMPNGGYLQTEWEITADDNGAAVLEVDLRTWLLPMLKPRTPGAGDPWAECDLIGVGKGDKAPLLMQWRLVRLSDGAVGECRQTLRVGVKNANKGGTITIANDLIRPGELYTSII